MIGLVKKYTSSRLNNRPFPDRYNSTNGQMITFYDRSAVGGHFALVRFSLSDYPWSAALRSNFLFSSFLFLRSWGAPTAATVATVMGTRTPVNQSLVLRL
jgi:hypothetical protein